MKKTIGKIAVLVGFIAASIGIFTFIINYDVHKDPKNFFSDPVKYVEEKNQEKQQKKAKQIAKEQAEILTKEEEERKKTEERERKAREAEAERLRKLMEEEMLKKAREEARLKSEKSNSDIPRYPKSQIEGRKKSSDQTSGIILLVIAVIGVISWIVYKYVIKKPGTDYDDDYIARLEEEDEDDSNDIFP
jgi:F0F1-type ATP synthase membrane subunit b/b'